MTIYPSSVLKSCANRSMCSNGKVAAPRKMKNAPKCCGRNCYTGVKARGNFEKSMFKPCYFYSALTAVLTVLRLLLLQNHNRKRALQLFPKTLLIKTLLLSHKPLQKMLEK